MCAIAQSRTTMPRSSGSAKRADGSSAIYNDLPKRYWCNINREPPFGDPPGDQPRLSDRDVDDIVAFLKALTDAWRAN